MVDQILQKSAIHLKNETWMIDYVKKNRDRFVYEVVPNYVTVILKDGGSKQQRLMVRDIRRNKSITMLGHRIVAIVNRVTGEFVKAEEPGAIMEMINEALGEGETKLSEWHEDPRELREIASPPNLDQNGCISGLKAKLPWTSFAEVLDYAFLEKAEVGTSVKTKVWTRAIFPKLRLSIGDVVHFGSYPDGNPIIQVKEICGSSGKVKFDVYLRSENQINKSFLSIYIRGLEDFMTLARHGIDLSKTTKGHRDG